MSYLKDAARGQSQTPQSEPIPGSSQVENSAGGFSWEVSSWTRLERFLILGSEGGTYYVSERKLTGKNIDALRECLALDPQKVVETIVSVSHEGRAHKNDQAIFALAYCIANGSDDAKRRALDAIPQVCRIGTHLFQLCGFLDAMGKLTGRAKRRALGRWYTDKPVDKLAYDAIKYRQRDGWGHRDVLRLAHPASKVSAGNPTVEVSDAHARLFDYIVRGAPADTSDAPGTDALPIIIEGFERAQKAGTPAETAALVHEYGLPREALKTEHLTSVEVWTAMLERGMPITAMIRNLGNMTRIGVLTPTSSAVGLVVGALTEERLKKGRVHPMSILFAMRTYASGHGFRGSGSWSPVAKIVDALDEAFYASFGAVEPTNKRVLLALDVSGSMGTYVANTNVSAREASTAMALVTAAVEDRYECVAFAAGGTFNRARSGPWGGGSGLVSVPLSKRQRLDDAMAMTERLPFGGTDCALPMLYAIETEREVDTFIVYTDSETWAGTPHPAQALQGYRRSSGIADAKLIVVGMTSNGFSIADPNDPGMLDVVGFDTNTPNAISWFAQGGRAR